MHMDPSTESSSRSAIVFPGMGAMSFADAGRFMVANPYARRLVAIAEEVLGYSLVDGYRQSEHDYSEAAQVAFLVNCLALAEWAEAELGVTPDLCAGPSFGGKAAAAYTGCLPFSDAVLMTTRLAACQDDYFAEHHTDVVTHSFVRTPEPKLREMLAEFEARDEWYEISCYVDHDLYMVSLREGGLERFKQRIRSLGGLSLYTMRPPLHSALFAGLRRRAEDEVLGKLPFADPRMPIVSDHDGTLLTEGDQIRTLLLDGIVRPMRWPDVVGTLRGQDVTTVHVAGPDNLFGRVSCTTDHFDVVRVNPRLALQPRSRPHAEA
ncbi:ACP S-malonyltransferase [Streptomyces sp. b94]|uniref:ACP S-malonyltransferase n=1 Tax=Streptomyces sp. b94 TaxID=1827634 RepID=UPI001B388BE6|nr:ACP S-malonyltransferase [Streptomyces sp. b94]MBQ1097261.1 ACP S-malonyltransferase [Streptomyces sp. b94]